MTIVKFQAVPKTVKGVVVVQFFGMDETNSLYRWDYKTGCWIAYTQEATKTAMAEKAEETA